MSSNELDFCRLCFREDGNISVFEYESNDDSWTLSDRIFECVSVQISQDDKLPQTVCECCLQFIIRWCEFKTICDRNQRTWLLWLRSLCFGSSQEILEGLAENARRKCLELGVRTLLSPEKGAFNRYRKSSLRPDLLKQNCTNISIDLQEQNHGEILKIESTQSLVGVFEKDKEDNLGTKLTNGYILVDSSSVPCEKSDKRISSQDSCTIDLSEKILESPPSEQDSGVNNSGEVEKSKEVVVSNDSHLGKEICSENVGTNHMDVESADKEVENAFCSRSDDVDDIPEREVALLNGDDPPSENISVCGKPAELIGESRLNPDLTDNTINLQHSTQSLLKARNGSFSSILKARLMREEMNKEFRINDSLEQPRRPDTPYPHEILRNMAANCPSSQVQRPSSVVLRPPEAFTAPSPIVQVPEITLKPSSLLHSISKPHPPPSSSSERVSESSVSDSASYNLMQMGVTIKDEILSDEGETDDDKYSYDDISIKMEPLDYQPGPLEECVDMEGPHDLECRYCKLCRKRFTCSQKFFKHLHSQLHKRVSSFAALGHPIDNKVIAQLNREIKSQAYFRGYAKKQMIAMDREDTSIRDGLEESGVRDCLVTAEIEEPPRSATPSSAVRQADSNLLECKVCNMILPSRSSKLKHDGSKIHQQNLEALMNKDAEITPQSMLSHMQQASKLSGQTSFQTNSYICPFASCSAVFSDGGQLIVHMHTHGISLPIHETNKQIQYCQEQNQLNQLPSQHNQQVQQNQITEENRIDNIVSKTEVPPGSSKLSCRRCNRSFHKGTALSNHVRVCRVPLPRPTAPLQGEKCPVCQIVLKNRRSVLYHMKMYHSDTSTPLQSQQVDNSTLSRDFLCTICGKSYTSKMNLRSHIHKVHKKKSTLCKICNKAFSTISNLNAHYKTHFNLKEGEYLCHVCFEVFKTKRECILHQKTGCTANTKLFPCTECIYTTRNQESLDQHTMEVHPRSASPVIEEQEPVRLDTSCLNDLSDSTCKLCNKVYSSNYNLKRHVKERHSHLLGTPSKVNVSTPSTSFSMTNAMSETPASNDSIAVNLDSDKDILCMYCDSMFTTRKSMIHHMKTICKMIPPKPKCKSCKSERWPWFIGPCQECGKDINSLKRKPSSLLESACKKPKLSEVQITPHPPTSDVTTVAQPKTQPPSNRAPKKVKDMIFKCPIGKRTFLSHKSMTIHSVSCNGSCKDCSIFCKACSQVYQNPKIYLKHKPCAGKNNSQVQKSLTFKCDICPLKFYNKSTCYKHMVGKHKHYRSGKMSKTVKGEGSKPKIVRKPKTNNANVALEEAELSVLEPSEQKTDISVAPVAEDVWTCEACLKTFTTDEALTKHIQNVHKNKFKKVDCTFCSKSIFKRELYEHGFTCIRDQLASIDTLECVVCSTIFYSNDEEDTISLKLQEHILNCCGKLSTGRGERLKNKEKFLCLKCCMLFSSKKSLYAHSYERHNILIQTSPTSQSKSNSASNKSKVPSEDTSIAQVNQDDTSTIQAFKCPKCHKSFKTQKGLKCHRAHVGSMCSPKLKVKKTVLKCNFCQREFFSELKLRNHEKVHGIVKEIVMTEEIDISQSSTPQPDQSNSKLSVKEIIDIVMES